MRKKLLPLLLVATLVSAFTGPVISAELQIDDDFMRTVEDTNKSLASNIAGRDAKSSLIDAKELEGMFAQIESYYQSKADAEEALKLTRKSKDLSVEIKQLIGAKDFDTATTKATDLSRACKSCHNHYKKS